MEARGTFRRPGRLIALGALMVLLAGSAAATGPGTSIGPPQPNGPDLTAMHNGKAFAKNNCLGCHADVMKQATLDKNIKAAHAAMVPFAPGYDAKKGATNQVCVSCHEKVDLMDHSAAQIRRNVSVDMCAACHGNSGPASKKFYAN